MQQSQPDPLRAFNSNSFDGFLARLRRRRPKSDLFLPIIREAVKVLRLNLVPTHLNMRTRISTPSSDQQRVSKGKGGLRCQRSNLKLGRLQISGNQCLALRLPVLVFT